MKSAFPKHKKLTYLKGRITEQGKTYRSVSEKTGIALNTLSNKINGFSLFDIVEVATLCEELSIPPNEIPKFFLSSSYETQHTESTA